MRKKTDNHNLSEKVALRSKLCALLNAPLRVLDLFSGEGRIWQEMRKQFQVAAYTPVDQKPRQPGAIKMKVDGRTVKAFDPMRFNVIDVDAYGDPFEVWESLHSRITTPTAIFLTFGHPGMGIDPSHFLLKQAGIPIEWDVPGNKELIQFLGNRYFVRSLSQHRVTKAVSIHNPNVSYYGALLNPV